MTNVERFFALQNQLAKQEKQALSNHPFPSLVPKMTIRAAFGVIERLGRDTTECELAIYLNNLIAASVRRNVPHNYKLVELQEEMMGELLLECLFIGLNAGAKETARMREANEQTLIASYHINPYQITQATGLRNELLVTEGTLPEGYSE